MTEKDFIRLLDRYLNGQCTDEEIKLLDRWYDQLGNDSLLMMTGNERLALKQKLWQKINEETESAEEQQPVIVKPLRSYVHWRWAVAAAVVLLVGIGAIVTMRLQQQHSLPGMITNDIVKSGVAEQTNTTDKPQQIRLTDGSIIQLEPHSSIRYTTSLTSSKRETWLKGEAFFEVKRNPARPFLVYSGEVATRVLGTSFWVIAPADARTVEVAVHTGKVAVFKHVKQPEQLDTKTNDEAEAVITPNQKVIIFVDQNRVTRSLIEAPEPIALPSQSESISYVFEESPLPEVLSRLEKTYGIEMSIGNKALANCRFTGNITQQPLYSKLELVCQAINARYEIQGTRIVINGVGCTP